MNNNDTATINAINILSEDEVVRDAVEGYILARGYGWEWTEVGSSLIDFATYQLDTFTDAVIEVDDVDWDAVVPYFM